MGIRFMKAPNLSLSVITRPVLVIHGARIATHPIDMDKLKTLGSMDDKDKPCHDA